MFYVVVDAGSRLDDWRLDESTVMTRMMRFYHLQERNELVSGMFATLLLQQETDLDTHDC